MDDTLRLIRYLYGEENDDSGLERRLVEDDSLRDEFDRLRETKEHLDRRRPQRPDSEIVDRVVEHARAAAASGASRRDRAPDREPQAPRRSWNRRLQAVAAALALLLAVGVGWWRLPADEASPNATTEATSSQGAATSTSNERAGNPEDVPAWDDREELIRIHRDIERLQARSGPNEWGTLQTVGQSQP